MSIIIPPSAGGNALSFQLQRAQDDLTTLAGVTQITSYADRRYVMKLQVVSQKEPNLSVWSLFMERLSDRTNVFPFGPPWYTGPTTGYAGLSPVVRGAGQTGLTLTCDGVTPSTNILNAGDYFSFDTTSPQGATNRQLCRCTQAATSDSSGIVAFQMVAPIRQAPLDNASVNILTPTALFMFTNPIGGVTDLDTMLRSGFTVDAIEKISR